MNLVINKCVTAVKVSNFSCHYLRNRSTLDIGVLGYIVIVQHKEHPPEVWSVLPVIPCIKFCQFVLQSLFPCNKVYCKLIFMKYRCLYVNFFKVAVLIPRLTQVHI